MIGRRIKTATSILLATLVTASTVAPPAIRHNHPLAEGEQVHHRHDAEHSLLGGADHAGHKHSHHQIGRGAIELTMALGQLWHLHIEFLGFDVTLPDRHSGERDDGPESTVECVMLWSGKAPATVWTAAASQASELLPGLIVSAVSDAISTQDAPAVAPPILSAPLCDRARHERSGVLLA